MNIKTLITLSVLTASTALFATDKIVDVANSFAGFPDSKDDVNVYYTGPTGTGDAAKARLGVANINVYYNVKSITLKGAGVTVPGTDTTTNDPSLWNILGNYNIDIATESGEYYAIKNESQGYISHQMGAITIKNSVASSTATAIIDGGNRVFTFLGGGHITQYPTLSVQTNTKLTTTSGSAQAVYFTNASRLNVSNNSTFTIDAAVRMYNEKYTGYDVALAAIQAPVVNVESGSSLITNKGVSLEGDTQFNVAGNWRSNGQVTTLGKAQINVTGKWLMHGKTVFQSETKAEINSLEIWAGGGINVYEKASVYVKNLFHGYGHTLSITGTFETGSSTNFAQFIVNKNGTLKQTSGDTTKIERGATVRNGGTFSTTGYLEINGGLANENTARWAAITIEDGANFFVDGKDASGTSVVVRNGELILNKANAMTTSAGEFLALTNANNSTGAILRIGANQTFKSITADTKNIDIYLSTESSATLAADFFAVESGKIVIHDFAENRVCIGNEIADVNAIFDAYQTINGEEVKLNNLYLNNGWLSALPAVPEPAEWAMILGSLALGLAIYRRRK
ncbi:MAG: hypothetical protein IJF70_02180, partial [Opitutales bacterium]|nr:hypothetical protein [Opitutales bacterium]